MSTEVLQHVSDAHPDLLYIEITAWATVGLVIATIFMIYWQIKATRSTNKIELSMMLMERYDSMQLRQNRKSLALYYLGDAMGSNAIETLLDALENIGMLQRRKLVDDDLIESAFAVPVRYWWYVLKDDISKMRSEFHDVTLFEDFEQLARKYDKAELEHRRVPVPSDEDKRMFLMSEVRQIQDDSYVVTPH